MDSAALQHSNTPVLHSTQGVFFFTRVYRFRHCIEALNAILLLASSTIYLFYQKDIVPRAGCTLMAYSLLFVKNLEVLDSFNSLRIDPVINSPPGP
jgi:hypothetical protein